MSLTFKDYLIQVHEAEGDIDPEELVQQAIDHVAARNTQPDDEDQQ